MKKVLGFIKDKLSKLDFMDAVYLILLLTAILYIAVQAWKKDQIQKETTLLKVELSTLKDSVAVYKNKNGELTYMINSVEIEKGELKKALALSEIDIKDLKERDIKWRKITEVLKAKLEANGNGTAPLKDTVLITVNDTIQNKIFSWNDEHLFMDGMVYHDKIDFNYKYKIGINYLKIPEKNGTTVYFILDSDKAEITTAQSLYVKNKTKWYNKNWLWGLAGLTGGFFLFK